MSRPGLWERLRESARVTVVSAPPGSGKTVLLRSWIGDSGLGERAAWVLVGRDEGDAQRFWLSVLGALRQTGVHVRFVGDQDHLWVSAGEVPLVWLCSYSPDNRLTGRRRR